MFTMTLMSVREIEVEVEVEVEVEGRSFLRKGYFEGSVDWGQ